ncbi:heat shock 70 kDa protein 12B-like [Mercenaria mercenaria]|uniref:heat shock 70 kDa protein 12B-like n=1 Tax=Mercenaria mercenaria TaxID=6596 RepID=UPI00234E9483|nr:heat shock 70 kDa protein 12B-like [Mercenaria mercenaria]
MAEGSLKYTKLLVAAMDFGTTYSGYAFSFRDKPNNIQTNPSWVAGSAQLMSMKCPTSVLLKPNKEFHSFGFEAENKYAELAEDKEHQEWYLFRRFKMALYETKKLQLDTPVEDIMGKKMPALDIISHSIRFLKNHLWKTIQTRTTGVLETDILYVLTVPAIWDERAKQFMRRAANKADISNRQLTFALEPEAASIWCQVVTDDTLTGISEPLAKYMVVDLGGGTADITVHEKLDDGSLKELQKASGGAWGGNEVDKAYMKMFADIVGPEAMETFRNENMTDYFDLLRDFETKKRTITTDTEGKMTFKIPAVLRELAESGGENIEEKIEMSPYKKAVTWAGDKLRIDKTAAKTLFDIPSKMLIRHINKLFAEPSIQDVEAILLVGGFGECALLKAAFEENFSNKRLMIPSEAGLAVLKGAVRFGHLPDLVSTRIARFTIGKRIMEEFKDHHDPNKKIVRDGVEKCSDVFRKLIEIDEEVPRYKYIREISRPAFPSQQNCVIVLVSSTKHDVMYTTESECQILGKLKFSLPKSSDIADKKYAISYFFGETEIHIHVRILKTNEEHETWIDCFTTRLLEKDD